MALKIKGATALNPSFVAVLCFAALLAGSMLSRILPWHLSTASASCTYWLPALGHLSGATLQGSTSEALPSHSSTTDQSRSKWKLTILLHTSEATWDSRARAIRDTWLSVPLPPGVRMFWVLEKNLTSEPSIQINHSPRPGLKPWHAEPKAMGERVLQAFTRVVQTEEVSEWYLKVDDDTFVNVDNVMSLLETFEDPSTRGYYIGSFTCSWWGGVDYCRRLLGPEHYDCDLFQWSESDAEAAAKAGKRDATCNGPAYACGGSGYLLSFEALRSLLRYEQEVGCPRSYEDLMVGWTLMRALPDTSCIQPQKPFAFQAWVDDAKDFKSNDLATAHKILPDDMFQLWENLSSTTS